MIEIRVPDEQEGTKAVVRSWLKKVGDAVAENDPLVELETDKVTQEVPAPAAGVLAEILLETDAEAMPGALLGRIDAKDPVRPERSAEREVEGRPAHVSENRPSTSLRTNDVEARLSPSVRRACQQHGIDPSRIKGTGRGGRITREDVDRAVAAATTVQVGEASTAQPRHFAGGDIPHDRMRLKIAENMARAVAEQPHVTAVFEADFSAIAAHKKALAERGSKLSYTAYIVKAAAEAMAVAPAINGRWEDDRIAISPTIDIGVGTALGDKGLIVPVVKDAGSALARGDRPQARRPHRAGAFGRAQGRRRVGRKLHHLQSRRIGQPPRRADHPPPRPGRDPRRRQAREARRRARDWRAGRDPRPANGLCHADHRPSGSGRPSDQRLAQPVRRDPRRLAGN